jgi:hypothetical protein
MICSIAMIAIAGTRHSRVGNTANFSRSKNAGSTQAHILRFTASASLTVTEAHRCVDHANYYQERKKGV